VTKPALSPAFLEVEAPIDQVRTALLAIGATCPDRRSVAFELGTHLILLADEPQGSTAMVIGGDEPDRLAAWLLAEIADLLPNPGSIMPQPPAAS
jgi:hypothetical protein